MSIDLIFIGNSICFHTGNNSSLLFMPCYRQIYVSRSSIYSIMIHHVKGSITLFCFRHHLGPQNILKKNFCVINHHHVVFLYYHSVSLHYKKTRIYSWRMIASIITFYCLPFAQPFKCKSFSGLWPQSILNKSIRCQYK